MQGRTQRIITPGGEASSPQASPGHLGKYEIREPIGEGGFGIVYKGFDPFIKRHVAIKTCTSADPELRQRYYREAEIAGRLDHPNIVRIFDFGIEDETPYLVQEFLSGCDLDHKIEGRAFVPYPERLLYLIHIARGLAYAHDQGVVHRDIKPANIRILDDSTAKIMDFGVAMLQNADTRLTRDGMAVGTAAYLSPEQVQGLEVDPRTDVFSYGALAYELVTGQKPFAQDTISATLFSVLHDDPRPISLPETACPTSLRGLVYRCLQKDPADRYPDFASILADLDDIREQLRPRGRERDLTGQLERVSAVSNPQQPTARPPKVARRNDFDPTIHHLIDRPSSPRRQGRRSTPWLLSLLLISLLAGSYAFLAHQGLAPWPESLLQYGLSLRSIEDRVPLRPPLSPAARYGHASSSATPTLVFPPADAVPAAVPPPTPTRTRPVEKPVLRPGRLSVQPSLGSPQGIVSVAGEKIGISPVRDLRLKAGRHRIEVFAISAPTTVLAQATVEVRPNQETVVTFDLTGQRQLAVRFRPLEDPR